MVCQAGRGKGEGISRHEEQKNLDRRLARRKVLE